MAEPAVNVVTRQPAKVTSFAGGNEAAVRKKRLGDFFPGTTQSAKATLLHRDVRMLRAQDAQE
jgi:hypothetical protein